MQNYQTPLDSGQIYHVWTHANGNENLFREERNYSFFLGKYIKHISPIADTFAYCLMPNHLHLMVRIKSEEDVMEFVKLKKKFPTLQGFETLGGLGNVISRQFSHLFNSYTQAYNKVYDRKGSLFIPNFKRKHINSDKYYLSLLAYIHLNPVHHGFVIHPDEWKHSSWHAYNLEKQTQLRKKEVFDWSGGKDRLIKFHEDIRLEKLKRMFENEDEPIAFKEMIYSHLYK